MSKQERKYQSPESETYREGVFEFAKQWCDADKEKHRGAMVMLTDEEGTHYMFIGDKNANIKGAYDLCISTDFKKAGRCVQIAFEIASCIAHIDKVVEKAGIDLSKAKNYMEREAMYEQLPEYNETMVLIQHLNEELKRYGKKSNKIQEPSRMA